MTSLLPNARRGRSLDLGLRLGGVALLICCAIGTHILLGMAPRPGEAPTTILLLLAAATFACFSAGTGLAAFGRQIFEEVPTGARGEVAGQQGRAGADDRQTATTGMFVLTEAPPTGDKARAVASGPLIRTVPRKSTW